MPVQINIGGTWKTIDTASINVGGTWKTPDTISINVGGTWKQIWPSPATSATADGDTNYVYDATCYVGVEFNTSGVEWELAATTGNASVNMGNWLDAGASSEVWVEFIRTGGTKSQFVGLSNSTRYQLNTTRKFYITAAAIGYNTETIIGYFKFWDAASGGNTLQTTSGATWQADAEAAGGCPLCCFTPATPITMADGTTRMIGEIVEGDLIRVRNGIETVKGVIIRRNRPMYMVTLSDGRTLHMSDEHPIYVETKGYAAINPVGEYKDLGKARQLEVGDLVATLEGAVTITSIEESPYPGKVYTLVNSHFFANGVLVY